MIEKVKLTAREKKLLALIPSPSALLNWDGDWDCVADVMEILFDTPNKRDAIPEIRLRLFSESGLAEKHNKSPLDIFEQNGNSNRDIKRHPHFVKYLDYFLNGPDLPVSVVEEFSDIVENELGTSGTLQKKCRQYVRDAVRQIDIERSTAATEFYRLAIELEMSPGEARVIRDAAISAR